MLESAFDKKNIHERPVKDSNFTQKTTLLFFTSFGFHVTYAKKQPNGAVEFCDPEYIGEKHFDTVDKFANTTSDVSGYTGVRLTVSKRS